MTTTATVNLRLTEQPDRCPYCGQTDADPPTHLSGGRCAVESTAEERRQADVQPIVERRLSPMAARVAANKAAGLRLGGDRPTGSDESAARHAA